jgi:hypothetical protein
MQSLDNRNRIAAKTKDSSGTMRFSTHLTPSGRNCQFQISGMVQCGKLFPASKRRWATSHDPYAGNAVQTRHSRALLAASVDYVPTVETAHDSSDWRALASKPGGAHSFPSLPDYERHKSQGSYGIGPRSVPDGVNAQTCEGDPCHISAQGGFRSISLQSGARSNSCQLPFPAGEPRHCNCGGQQNSNSDQAPLRFAISKKIQNGSQHHESREREKQNSRNPSCPCLIEFGPKTPEHDGCRKQLDQTVSTESEQSGTVRTPSRPERNDSLYGHPDDGENLKLKNAPRDIRQFR